MYILANGTRSVSEYFLAFKLLSPKCNYCSQCQGLCTPAYSPVGRGFNHSLGFLEVNFHKNVVLPHKYSQLQLTSPDHPLFVASRAARITTQAKPSATGLCLGKGVSEQSEVAIAVQLVFSLTTFRRDNASSLNLQQFAMCHVKNIRVCTLMQKYKFRSTNMHMYMTTYIRFPL